jgi:predicted signal transduction protein with EAL and GGDEF domain
MRTPDARETFLERVRRRGAGPRHALLVLAPDGFSGVDDALGRRQAHALLRGVAERLQLCLPGLTSAQVGEREFALALPLSREQGELAAHWAELHAYLSLPFCGEWGEASLRFSAGVARLGSDGSDAEQVLDAARTALHRAQHEGGGRCLPFRRELLREARQRVELASALRRALERRELTLHYQPVVACATGELRGVEALVRWNRPLHGWVPPAEFVPLAEETGLIHELGEFALREVLQQRARWRRQGGPLADAHVALNVSARQLDDERFVQALERAAGEGELRGPPLWLELTETALVADGASARTRLQRLRALGVRLALDDLGTGYSALVELRNLPLDGLKLDQRLTAGVGSDPLSTRLFEALCGLAQSIPLCLVAEGIETHAQLAVLCSRGCKLAQGFLWSPALPAAELERWTDSRLRYSA